MDDTQTPILSLLSPDSNRGLVTTLENVDLPVVQQAMRIEAGPLKSAGIFAPPDMIIRFAAYFPPETPFSYIILRLHGIARTHPRFHLCNLRDVVAVADAILDIRNLTIEDRITFSAAPVDLRDPEGPRTCVAFARCISNQGGGGLLDIQELNLEILDAEMTSNPFYLRGLESLHKALVLYIWLSYRFNGIFPSQAMAFHVKTLVEEKINVVLSTFANTAARRALNKYRKSIILHSLNKTLWDRASENKLSKIQTKIKHNKLQKIQAFSLNS
jgi:ATP-dependent RNA helicase SUPV3L1/SUV3